MQSSSQIQDFLLIGSWLDTRSNLKYKKTVKNEFCNFIFFYALFTQLTSTKTKYLQSEFYYVQKGLSLKANFTVHESTAIFGVIRKVNKNNSCCWLLSIRFLSPLKRTKIQRSLLVLMTTKLTSTTSTQTNGKLSK